MICLVGFDVLICVSFVVNMEMISMLKKVLIIEFCLFIRLVLLIIIVVMIWSFRLILVLGLVVFRCEIWNSVVNLVSSFIRVNIVILQGFGFILVNCIVFLLVLMLIRQWLNIVWVSIVWVVNIISRVIMKVGEMLNVSGLDSQVQVLLIQVVCELVIWQVSLWVIFSILRDMMNEGICQIIVIELVMQLVRVVQVILSIVVGSMFQFQLSVVRFIVEVVRVSIEFIERLMLLMIRMKVMFIVSIIRLGIWLVMVRKVLQLRKWLFSVENSVIIVSSVLVRLRQVFRLKQLLCCRVGVVVVVVEDVGLFIFGFLCCVFMMLLVVCCVFCNW